MVEEEESTTPFSSSGASGSRLKRDDGLVQERDFRAVALVKPGRRPSHLKIGERWFD